MDPLYTDALHKAVLSGSRNAVIKTISVGVSIDSRNAVGESALHICAQDDNHRKMANYLIKKKADVNAKNIAGETPLHYACFHKNNHLVKLLLKNGADPNARTKQGMLPAQLAKDSKTKKLMAAAANNMLPLINDNKYVQNYILRETIGIGSFGKVKLATHRDTGETFAVKIIKKDVLLDDSNVGKTLWREICIMHLLNHENLVNLVDTMEDERKLYLVMEFARGVELLDFIVQQKRAPEHVAKHLFRQIVAAVEHMHYMKIVHRDLKLENIMIDVDTLKLKIFDFGLSNIIRMKDSLLKTSCGSPFYTAPEMLARKEYGESVDMWSLGIVLYAILIGRLPFEDDFSNGTVFEAVMSLEKRLFIPSFVSDEAVDLIKALLRKNPNERMTIKTIKKHEWMKPCDGPIVFLPPSLKVNQEAFRAMEYMGYDMIELKNDIETHRDDFNTHVYLMLSKRYENDEAALLLAEKIFGVLSDQLKAGSDLSSEDKKGIDGEYGWNRRKSEGDVLRGIPSDHSGLSMSGSYSKKKKNERKKEKKGKKGKIVLKRNRTQNTVRMNRTSEPTSPVGIIDVQPFANTGSFACEQPRSGQSPEPEAGDRNADEGDDSMRSKMETKAKLKKKKLKRFKTLPSPKRSKVKNSIDDVFGIYDIYKERSNPEPKTPEMKLDLSRFDNIIMDEQEGASDKKIENFRREFRGLSIESDSSDSVAMRSASQNEMLNEWVRQSTKPLKDIVREVERVTGVADTTTGDDGEYIFHCSSELGVNYNVVVEAGDDGFMIKLLFVSGKLTKFMDICSDVLSRLSL